MAKYRQVHTTFWDDGFVIDLTPEEKYFYLYLMTNSNTTQCGIYELPYRVIEMQTGYNRDTVLKLLKRFIEYGKIEYNEGTKEIMLLNWAKYNFINSPQVKKCIEKELKSVKHIPFVERFVFALEQNGYRIDTISILNLKDDSPKEPKVNDDAGSIPYQYPIDNPCIDLGEEEEKEEEKEEEQEKEKEQQQEMASPVVEEVDIRKIDPFSFYQQNGFGVLSSIVHFKILNWIKDLSDELVVYAMQLAIESNKVSWSYVEGILKNWANRKIRTVEQAEALRAQFEAQKQQQYNTPYKRGRQEVVPEWFDKHKQEALTSPPSTTAPVFDFEAERRKMLDKLNA